MREPTTDMDTWQKHCAQAAGYINQHRLPLLTGELTQAWSDRHDLLAYQWLEKLGIALAAIREIYNKLHRNHLDTASLCKAALEKVQKAKSSCVKYRRHENQLYWKRLEEPSKLTWMQLSVIARRKGLIKWAASGVIEKLEFFEGRVWATGYNIKTHFLPRFRPVYNCIEIDPKILVTVGEVVDAHERLLKLRKQA